jgi:hypothetical protein
VSDPPVTGFDLCRAAMAAPGVTAPERSVLMVLAIMADGRDATCYPPINGDTGLTAKTCLSERAVQRAIQQLVRLGHISRRQLRHGVIYTVHPQLTPATLTGVGLTGDTGTGDGETPDTQAPRGAPVAPKQPRTTNPKKATPSRGTRAGSRKAEFHRMPPDWKPQRFGDGSEARKVVDTRGQAWAKGQLEEFRAWAANAEDKDGAGRKLDWQQAFAKWINSADRKDRGNGRAENRRSGSSGGVEDGFSAAIREAREAVQAGGRQAGDDGGVQGLIGMGQVATN